MVRRVLVILARISHMGRTILELDEPTAILPVGCQPKSSVGSPFRRFHLPAARSMLGAGGPIAPQSTHWTVIVPLCTICGRSPQNGQGFSIGMTLSIISSPVAVCHRVYLDAPFATKNNG
jgi:hypothetical protein